MDTVIKHCSGLRGLTNEDSKNYCVGWRHNETFPQSCDWEEFKYKESSELQTYSMSGRLGYYGGGGYVIRLNRSFKEMMTRLEFLQQNSWIDQNTRSVIIEFSIYNVNVNLFSTCMISAEFNDGGGVISKWRFDPVRLISRDDFAGRVNLVAETLFVVATAFFTLRELWKIKQQKCSYFTDNWNLAEICILIVSYSTIGLYFYRFILTQENLDIFEKTNGNGYIRMDSAAYVDLFYLYSLAFIVFFCTIKIIKLLQFNKRMNVLAMTIRNCWDELKIFFVAFFIVFFAFSCLFFFMFNKHLEHFAQIVPAVQTCFKMMMGKFDFAAMNEANSMSPILFFIFSVMNSMVLINIMLTIIIHGFNTVKKDLEGVDNRLNVIDHAVTQYRIFMRKEAPKNVTVKIDFNDKKLDDDELPPPEKDKNEEFSSKVSQKCFLLFS